MSLSAGQRLNGYEIVDLLGAGGMGEVYRARDTRLNRDVALKVLPPRMAGNEAAFARFEREAQAVAALSHPNILAVYDFGRSDAASYVVFELLQGATVRARLDSGPLPVRKAVDYARQVADGLAAAHARSITHRDIKPDNLFVTDDGRVKILDFGLAQMALTGLDEAGTTATQAPITDAGTVLGTVGYMAPEQIRGQAVDHRADLFALGATLYEMCTGKRAFKGATPADTMSAVLSNDAPELTLAGQATPPALDRIVRRCLEKQPTERFQSARDLSFALDALSSLSGAGPGTTASTSPRRHGWVLPAAAAGLVALAAGIGAGPFVWSPAPRTAAPPAAPSLRAEFNSIVSLNTTMLTAVSPDGHRIAYSDVVHASGVRQLFVRELATGAVAPVADSDDGVVAAWSPTSDTVLFVSRLRELRRYRLGDELSTAVDPLRDGYRGAAWLSDDTIVVCVNGSDPVRRIPGAGGQSTAIVRGTSDGFVVPRPIGNRADHIVALRIPNGVDLAASREIVVIRLADGQVTKLANGLVAASVASGHLLMPRPSGLFVARFDTDRLVLTGEPVRVADRIMWDPTTGISSLSASDTGVLAFRPTPDRPAQFEWLDGAGRSLGLIGAPDFYGAFSLSGDGSRIVARLQPNPQRPVGGLRLIDIGRGVVSPIVTAQGVVSDPLWTLDGTQILYRLADALMRQSPFATEATKVRSGTVYPDALSRDGRWMLVGQVDGHGGFGLYVMSADGSGDLQALSTDEAASDQGAFSPDGRLVSFNSTRTGRSEVYVSRFPPTGERWQVSSEGGVQPRWSSDGRALYYVDLIGKLVRVAVSTDDPGRIGRPEALFDLGLGAPSASIEQYDIHGNRFLVLRPSKNSAPETVVVVSNWTSGLSGAAATAAR